ncbi:hypothetical protein [Phaeobacter sp. JH209A]|uniref:hypothetical protein n=1 Tax=Phaeobacter sp. JH209A TaxID=3112505 RepID=UPI003A874944
MQDIQFNRWNCPICWQDGIDSWHKAFHDGLDYGGEFPRYETFGHYCTALGCGADLVVQYGRPQEAPRVIIVGCLHLRRDATEEISSINNGFDAFLANRAAGMPLRMSMILDADWSRGCHAEPAAGQGVRPRSHPISS